MPNKYISIIFIGILALAGSARIECQVGKYNFARQDWDDTRLESDCTYCGLQLVFENHDEPDFRKTCLSITKLEEQGDVVDFDFLHNTNIADVIYDQSVSFKCHKTTNGVFCACNKPTECTTFEVNVIEGDDDHKEADKQMARIFYAESVRVLFPFWNHRRQRSMTQCWHGRHGVRETRMYNVSDGLCTGFYCTLHYVPYLLHSEAESFGFDASYHKVDQRRLSTLNTHEEWATVGCDQDFMCAQQGDMCMRVADREVKCCCKNTNPQVCIDIFNNTLHFLHPNAKTHANIRGGYAQIAMMGTGIITTMSIVIVVVMILVQRQRWALDLQRLAQFNQHRKEGGPEAFEDVYSAIPTYDDVLDEHGMKIVAKTASSMSTKRKETQERERRLSIAVLPMPGDMDLKDDKEYPVYPMSLDPRAVKD